jgi:DNA-binding MarR family transcriptional regulator
MSQAIPFIRPSAALRAVAAVRHADAPESLVAVATRLYAMRRHRNQVLGVSLFSEPAWDILLDLFISHHAGRQLSVSAVCIGACAPSATALRYLAILQEVGLVVRIRDESDGRRSYIHLSAAGRQRMSELLTQLS